jgi:hypothetical protein
MALDPQRLHRAVDLQERSYKLLVWMTDAVERGFISFRAAHQFASLVEATLAWIDRHYDDLPPAARPAREDVRSFANLFTTYLENSFDLVEHPGKRLFSPDAHCFCPLCSWLVDMPRLQTKKVTRHDKVRARKLQVSAVKQVALDIERNVSDEEAEVLVEALREPAALVAYGYDLLRRIDGVAEGPATLALWRGFAWTLEGSPKKGFELDAAAILAAEATIAAGVRGRAARKE